MVKVLFVCLGNICRSPTADGIFQKLVVDAGLTKRISVDSAGTAGWHQGKAPDPRTVSAALKRGFDLSSLRSRQVKRSDFNEFDYILAMDKENLADLYLLRSEDFTGHLGLFLEFSQQKNHTCVPDPYHGGAAGFELVLDLVEEASRGLLQTIRKQHQL
jgi:protein-tyrosine phosphatase